MRAGRLLLNKCAKEFVYELIKTKYPSFDEQIKDVEAERQWGHIDYCWQLLTINT